MRQLETYRPPSFKARIDLDLSKNEGQPPPQIESILQTIDPADVARYPDTGRLQKAIAERIGTPIDFVQVTAGGDDALARCFQANAGGRFVSTKPTFEMIRRYASQTGSELVEIPWWSGPLPLDAFMIEAEEADVAVVVSPNNPTGSVAKPEDLRALAATFPLVVLDAAYTEFAHEDLTETALDLGNVVTIRTLSKAFGMAGLRVGYLVGRPTLLQALSAFGSPYAVSGVSAEIARAALEGSTDSDAALNGLDSRRARLSETMERLGLDPLPSQANFVLGRRGSEWLVDSAAAMGIAIRSFPGSDDLDGAVRVTVPGSDGDLSRLLSALQTATKPEAIIFDLDGVIADVSRSYRQAIVETGDSFGVEITTEMISGLKAEGNANDDWELTWRLINGQGVEADLAEVTSRFEEIYQGTDTRPGLKENERCLVERRFLEALAADYRLAIVTGRPRRDAAQFLEREDLIDLFDAVISREDAPSKPDPRPVSLAMDELNATRGWMLGDTVDDLVAARAAGVLPIGVIAPGDDPDLARDTLSPAAAVLEEATQLKGLLDDQTS